MDGVIISFIILLIALFIGVPIPFAFFTSALIIVLIEGYDPSFLIPYGYQKAGSIILIAVPLFILSGSIMEKGHIGEKLVDVVEIIFGRIRGGLGAVSVVSCALFGAISGSGAATLACIGTIMFPRLEAAGYPRGYSASLLSNACVLGLLIPPSLSMILFAFVAAQSVLACFLATVVPGIILVIFMCIVNFVYLRNNKGIIVTENYNFPTTMKLLRKKSFVALPAFLMPVIILGGIYGGAMTPTEAAAISVLYALPVGLFIYKGINKTNIKETFLAPGVTSGVILTMLLGVMILSRLYIMENVPNRLLAALSMISDNPAVILIILNIFMIVVGMLMDDTSAILLSTPILLPVAVAIGVEPIHFAAIMGVNTGLGCVTPPCAPFLYLGSRLGKAPVNEMLRSTFALILFAWIPTLLLTTYVPEISLWLPRLILGPMAL